MPRTLLSKPKHAKLITTICGYAALSGKSNPELSQIIGRSQAVIYHRLKNPEDFTLGELLKLGRTLNIPIEELRQAITL